MYYSAINAFLNIQHEAVKNLVVGGLKVAGFFERESISLMLEGLVFFLSATLFIDFGLQYQAALMHP